MTDFPWTRPRQIGMDAATLGHVRAYEKGSLPAYPDEVEPPAELRARVYALTHLVPQIPACEDAPPVDDWYRADIACPTCEDSGEVGVGERRVLMPCPDCPGYDWREELYDDMERGK